MHSETKSGEAFKIRVVNVCQIPWVSQQQSHHSCHVCTGSDSCDANTSWAVTSERQRAMNLAVHCSATWKRHSHTWYIRIWRAKTNTDLIRKCTMNVNVPWMSIDICQQQVLASLLPVADVLPLRLCPMCHHQSPAGAWCSTAFQVAGSFKALTCPAYESIAESNGCYWVLWINFE